MWWSVPQLPGGHMLRVRVPVVIPTGPQYVGKRFCNNFAYAAQLVGMSGCYVAQSVDWCVTVQ